MSFFAALFYFWFLEVVFFLMDMEYMDESSSLLMYSEMLSVSWINGTGRLAAS